MWLCWVYRYTASLSLWDLYETHVVSWTGGIRNQMATNNQTAGYCWILDVIQYNPENLPSGKHTKNYGKSPFFKGKLTISMAMFNSYVELPEGKDNHPGNLRINPIQINKIPGWVNPIQDFFLDKRKSEWFGMAGDTPIWHWVIAVAPFFGAGGGRERHYELALC